MLKHCGIGILLFIASLVVIYIGSIVLFLLVRLLFPELAEAGQQVVVLFLVQFLYVLISFLAIYFLVFSDKRKFLPNRSYPFGQKLKDILAYIKLKVPTRRDVAWALGTWGLFFLAAIILVLLLSLLLQALGIDPDSQTQEVSHILADLDGGYLFLIFITITVIVPFTEEIWFRGFLHRYLRSKMGFVPSALLSSVFFSLVHPPLTVMIRIFFLSVPLTYAYEKTKNLTTAILIHMVNNFVFFFLMYFAV